MLPSIFPFSDVTRHIESGGMIVYPTETVYGLGGMPEESVISKIVALKQRRSNKPMLLLVPDRKSTEALVWTPEASMLADAFWPGPLTLLVEKKRNNGITPAATSNLDSIAIRVPSNPIILKILNTFGKPIAAPSANKFGMLSPTSALHVEKQFKDHNDIPLILDGGNTNIGIESTVIGIENNNIIIYRHGGVTKETLEEKIKAYQLNYEGEKWHE